MPLPLIIDKAVSLGKLAAQKVLDLANSPTAQRIGASIKSKGAIVIKNAAIGLLVTGAIAIAATGGILAIAGLAGLGTVGALTVSLLGAGAIYFSVTQIVSIVASTTNFVVNFDVNQTDQQLDQILIQKLESFYGLLGQVVGSSMGYLVCGAIPGALSFAFNPAVGAAIMRDLDDDARSEILGQVNVIARTAFQTMINAELVNRFKSSRRFLKKNPNNPFAKAVRGILGEENWKKWGDANNSSFTIHQNIIEKRIQAIPDKGKREFFEQALEGFADSCLESGYIVANNLDSQLAAQALMRQNLLGRPTDVQISFA